MPDSIARLLIVDDQPAAVGLLLAYLGDCDIDLLVALNGEVCGITGLGWRSFLSIHEPHRIQPGVSDSA